MYILTIIGVPHVFLDLDQGVLLFQLHHVYVVAVFVTGLHLKNEILIPDTP